MTTILTSIADPHWCEGRPISRTDTDWIKTQTQKIENVFNVSSEIEIRKQKGSSGLLIPGDLFHLPKGPRISRRLDRWLSQTLRFSPCPIFAIPGNHDMQGHHLDSLNNHPYGCLEAAGLITSVIWPNYMLVGEDPLVMVTGKQFVPEGPGFWLQMLREEETLVHFKKELEQQHQKPVFVVAMSHGYWGSQKGSYYGEPVVPYSDVYGTGIDIMLISHDHACHGVNVVEGDRGAFQWVVGSGALVRGTISEKDLRREPKMAVLGLNSHGDHEIFLVTIPHLPVEEVFALEEKAKERKIKEEELVFIEECRKLDYKVPTIEVILGSLLSQGVTSVRVASLVKNYLLSAEGSGALDEEAPEAYQNGVQSRA
jgi:hypothetical protein